MYRKVRHPVLVSTTVRGGVPGYLPGTLWILIGAVLGGCVQDFVTLFFSVRRDGRSLGQMAKDELGSLGGTAAMMGVMMIMIILIAVLSEFIQVSRIELTISSERRNCCTSR